jgi:hypothetical protein
VKAHLTLADAASPHPDGTISMLRSGINQFWGQSLPISISGALVIRIETNLGDFGNHQFDLRCFDTDGAMVIAPLEGQFSAPRGEGVVNLVLGVSARLPKFGRYEFVLRIDNHQQDTWTFTATALQPPSTPTS